MWIVGLLWTFVFSLSTDQFPQLYFTHSFTSLKMLNIELGRYNRWTQQTGPIAATQMELHEAVTKLGKGS